MKKSLLIALMIALFATAMPFAALATEAAAPAISDDLYAFQAVIDGVLYTFPCLYSEFEANGWTFKEKEEAETPLQASSYGTLYMIKGGIDSRMEMRLDFVNFDIATKPANQCYIGGFSIEKPWSDTLPTPVVMAKGIQTGDGAATRESITAAFGEASRVYEGSVSDKPYVTLTYEKDTYENIKFTLNDNKLDGVELQCLVEPKDMPKAEVSKDVPDYIKEYQAPTELGSDPLSMRVEFAGDLYTLPAPVSAFLANGWKVTDTRQDFVAAKDFVVSGITLMRENKSVDLMLYNFADVPVIPENACVSSMPPFGYTSDGYTFSLVGGIKLGSTKDEVMKVFEPIFTRSDKRDEYTTYHAYERGKYSLSISIDNKTNLVTDLDLGTP